MKTNHLTEEDYLGLPEGRIDLATAALLIEKEVVADCQIDTYIDKIVKITDEVRLLVKDIKSEHDRINAIIEFLFQSERFERNDSNHFLTDVLDKGSGNCTSLTCLFLSITGRLDMPFRGVFAPLHVFARYDYKKKRINIDPLLKGASYPNSTYIEAHKIHEVSLQKNIYLKSLTKKEFLASHYFSRGMSFMELGEYDRAIKDYYLALELYPYMPEAYSNLATAFKLKKEYLISLSFSDKALKLNPNFTKALAIRGHTKFLSKNYKGALSDYNEAIRISPEEYSLYSFRGDLLSFLNQHLAAMADYNVVLQNNPNDAVTYHNRGIMKYLMKDALGACRDWKVAFRLGYGPAFYNLKYLCDEEKA
jgi:tetratricopeptide (TPR) repeat protein